MTKYLLFFTSLFFAGKLRSQTIDSLYFNLYTDSLKKGTLNYINVEARYSNGKYLPLNDSEIAYSSTAGSFERNSLLVPFDCKEEKITIRVKLKSKPSLTQSVTLYIKKKTDNENLKTVEEILNQKDKTTTPTGKIKKSKRNK